MGVLWRPPLVIVHDTRVIWIGNRATSAANYIYIFLRIKLCFLFYGKVRSRTRPLLPSQAIHLHLLLHPFLLPLSLFSFCFFLPFLTSSLHGTPSLILMDHHDNHNTANLPHGGPYGFYPTEQEANFDMVYPQQGINNYQVVPAAPPPRGSHQLPFILVF